VIVLDVLLNKGSTEGKIDFFRSTY